MSKKDKKSKEDHINTIKSYLASMIGTNCRSTDDSSMIPRKLLHKWQDDSSVFIGGVDQFLEDSYVGLREGEDGNIIIAGGSGSGKTTRIVRPTLLTWRGSMCVTDVKGELSAFYQELYKKGIAARAYIIFDPTKTDCPKYDPFAVIRNDDQRNLLSNIKKIVVALHPILPGDTQRFWAESERAALEAGLLYYYNKCLCFIEAIAKITQQTLSELCEELEEDEDEDERISMLLGELKKTSREVRANIDRGLRNILVPLLEDPCFINAFTVEPNEAPGWTWDDLEEKNIFLCIPADRIDTWGRQINLMYSQLFRYLERRPEKYSPEGRNNVQTLLLMDEFARFGKLESITDSIATLRSKSVNFCLVVQSIAQLDKIYGELDRRIIFDNCQYQVILRANDADTQRYLSDLIGTRIIMENSTSAQMDNDKGVTGYSIQVSERQELVVRPHELSTLRDVLLLTPDGFYRIQKYLPEYISGQQP